MQTILRDLSQCLITASIKKSQILKNQLKVFLLEITKIKNSSFTILLNQNRKIFKPKNVFQDSLIIQRVLLILKRELIQFQLIRNIILTN